MTLKSFCHLLGLCILLMSCGDDILDADTATIKLDIEFVDVDSCFVSCDSTALIKAHHSYKKHITDIYNYELGVCLGIGEVDDSTFYNSIQQFVHDPYIIRLERKMNETFSDKTSMKNEILEGFKHLKHHFPNGKMPLNIVFLNTLFASNVFSTETEIGIGLERYLGESVDVIQELPNDKIFDWVKKGMNKEYLERDVLTGWIMTHYIDVPQGNLAEQMITWGKILYLTEAAFPNKKESLIARYTEEDYQWAKNNEFAFWKYLVDQEMLFKINELNTRNMLGEGPATLGLPEKGPDRMGQFLGWQMVRNYQEKHEVPLEKLIALTYNEILQEYEID